jgi:hypothetical protein
LVLIDFKKNKIIVYDDPTHADKNHVMLKKQVELIHKWISNLFFANHKEYQRFDHSMNQFKSYEGNNNCGVSVMVSCIYIMLDMKFELRIEDMNEWRMKIAFLITRFGINLPKIGTDICIDLTSV